MKINLCKVAGIPVFISPDWLMFVGIFLLFSAFSGMLALFNTALLFVSVAVFILLHEFGHALTAKKFGIRTKDITLHFFGGIARIDERDMSLVVNKPRNGFWMWLAGPLVSLSLAGIFYLLMKLFSPSHAIYYLKYARDLNLAFTIFNMLPFWPMDGAGCMFSLINMFKGKTVAMKITSIVGIIGGILLIAAGALMLHIMLVVIGVIVVLSSYGMRKSALFVQ